MAKKNEPKRKTARAPARDDPLATQAPYVDFESTTFTTDHIPRLVDQVGIDPAQDRETQARVLSKLNDATKLFKLELMIDRKASDKEVLKYLQSVRSALHRINGLLKPVPVPSIWSQADAQYAHDESPEIIPVPPDMTVEEFARSISEKANSASADQGKGLAEIDQRAIETNDEPSDAFHLFLSHQLDEVLAEAKLGDAEIFSATTGETIAFSPADDLLVNFIHSAKLIERAANRAVRARMEAGPVKAMRGKASQEFAFRVLAAFEELFSTPAGRSNASSAGRGGPASRFVSECFRIADISQVPRSDTLVKWIAKRNRTTRQL